MYLDVFPSAHLSISLYPRSPQKLNSHLSYLMIDMQYEGKSTGLLPAIINSTRLWEGPIKFTIAEWTPKVLPSKNLIIHVLYENIKTNIYLPFIPNKSQTI
jgi:hypothetical protein